MTAVLVHLAIVIAVGVSLDRTQPRFQMTGGGGAVLASLTPAAVVYEAVAKPSTNMVDKVVSAIGEAPAPPDPIASKSSGIDLLAQLDQSLSPPSRPASSRASATAQSVSATSANVSLRAADNPWSHASAAPLDASKVRELWAAIQPCWRGRVDERATSIRVVLGSQGEVVEMTALGDAGGAARSSAEALATAVSKCAPYRVGRADAYLVTGPV